MKTILVPTDFSPAAHNALNYALQMAKKFKSEIILYHSWFPFESSFYPAKQREEENKAQEKTLKKRMENIRDKMLKLYKDVTIRIVLEPGPPAQNATEYARKKKVNVIIMGTIGASGVKEVIVGSNAARVLEMAKCPVIAVPGNAHFDGINNITYATDYRASDISALRELALIAGKFGAKITLLHAADTELTRDAEEEIMRRFRNQVVKNVPYKNITYKVQYGNRLHEILQTHVKKEKPQLLAMSTRKRTFLEKMFGSSTTKKMVYHASVPLLAFHHKKQEILFI